MKMLHPSLVLTLQRLQFLARGGPGLLVAIRSIETRIPVSDQEHLRVYVVEMRWLERHPTTGVKLVEDSVQVESSAHD